MGEPARRLLVIFLPIKFSTSVPGLSNELISIIAVVRCCGWRMSPFFKGPDEITTCGRASIVPPTDMFLTTLPSILKIIAKRELLRISGFEGMTSCERSPVAA